MNRLGAFPQANRGDLERIFDIYLDEKSRTQIESKNRVTAENLNIGKTIVALSMQYLENGSIDIGFLESELQRLSENSIQTVLIAGTTGESSSLSIYEHITYVRIASQIAQRYGINIIAGAGSNSTSEQNDLVDGVLGGNFAIDQTQTRQVYNSINEINVLYTSGAVASLLLAPYYIKTSSENLVRHFMEGLNRGPAIIYSIKGRTGMEIPLEVLEILSRHPNFLGVKECDGSERIQHLVNEGITVWTGNDDSIVQDVSEIGAYGVISVTAGIIPNRVRNIIENRLMSGSDVEQNQIASELLFPPGYPNPHMIHNVFSLQRYDGTPVVFRSPVGPIGREAQHFTLQVMQTLGLSGNEYGENFRII